jgi:NAD(P)-dependent dehydrogenase (short-subunit alcohol dehydrogenase family)
MDIRLDGKRVLVTGGNSGIGEAMALAFADAGADVAVNYVSNEPAAKKVVQAIEVKGRKALALEANVADEQEVSRMFDELDRAWGGIDVLLDNAGIDGKRMCSFDAGEPDIARVVDVNLIGAFHCAREALKRMVHQKSGVVLFTSSVHQRIAWSGHAAYVATKAAVEMMMKTMAQEAGPYGVRVLSIAPGAVATPINAAVLSDKAWQEDLMNKVPLKRIGQPEDIASVALFLVSDQASYVTATTVFVDGGMTDYPAFAHGG